MDKEEDPSISTPASILEKRAPVHSKGSSVETSDDGNVSDVSLEEFKISKRLYVAFLTLAVITLMVALDGTSLSVALPVRLHQNTKCDTAS